MVHGTVQATSQHRANKPVVPACTPLKRVQVYLFGTAELTINQQRSAFVSLSPVCLRSCQTTKLARQICVADTREEAVQRTTSSLLLSSERDTTSLVIKEVSYSIMQCFLLGMSDQLVNYISWCIWCKEARAAYLRLRHHRCCFSSTRSLSADYAEGNRS